MTMPSASAKPNTSDQNTEVSMPLCTVFCASLVSSEVCAEASKPVMVNSG